MLQVDAIERSQSLEAHAVARALEGSAMPEFYADIAFDANHQIALPMLIVQVLQREGEESVVFPREAVTDQHLAFPMPTWAQVSQLIIKSEVTGNR